MSPVWNNAAADQSTGGPQGSGLLTCLFCSFSQRGIFNKRLTPKLVAGKYLKKCRLDAETSNFMKHHFHSSCRVKTNETLH